MNFIDNNNNIDQFEFEYKHSHRDNWMEILINPF